MKPNKVQVQIENLQKDMSEIDIALKDSSTSEDVRKDLQDAMDIMNAELSALTKQLKPKKDKKPKEVKPAKERVKIGGKYIDELSKEEAISLWQTRRAQRKENDKKFKSQSLISKMETHMTNAVEQAVSVIDVSADPKGAVKAMEKIGEIVDATMEKIRVILKPHVESADLKMSEEAKKDLTDFENMITSIKTKYNKN